MEPVNPGSNPGRGPTLKVYVTRDSRVFGSLLFARESFDVCAKGTMLLGPSMGNNL
mgnify:CR=1 FL=1